VRMETQGIAAHLLNGHLTVDWIDPSKDCGQGMRLAAAWSRYGAVLGTIDKGSTEVPRGARTYLQALQEAESLVRRVSR
jgi:hypothetical protein